MSFATLASDSSVRSRVWEFHIGGYQVLKK